MNLLEGGKGGEGRMGERRWGGDGGRVGREGGEGREGGRGGEGRGGEGRGWTILYTGEDAIKLVSPVMQLTMLISRLSDLLSSSLSMAII